MHARFVLERLVRTFTFYFRGKPLVAVGGRDEAVQGLVAGAVHVDRENSAVAAGAIGTAAVVGRSVKGRTAQHHRAERLVSVRRRIGERMQDIEAGAIRVHCEHHAAAGGSLVRRPVKGQTGNDRRVVVRIGSVRATGE